MDPNQNTTTNLEQDQVFEKTPSFKNGGTTSKTDTTNDNIDSEDDDLQSLTPLQRNDWEWKHSEIKKNKAKTACWNVVKPCIVVISTIISIIFIGLAIFWAYQISSIAEPIGGIKVQINDLIKYRDDEIKPRFKDWDSIFTELKIKEVISPETR